MFVELIGLSGVALVLGMRHGLDADHLATIDGLTRSHAHRPDRLAYRCGLWFSAGHGISIIAVSIALTALGQAIALPAWLRTSGMYVAACVLLTLASVNLRMAWVALPGKHVHPISIKWWVAQQLGGHLGTPLGIFGLGGLFAISFDALGAAALFAASAVALGKPWFAVILALVFALGMMTVDGLASWANAWLLRRSHALDPAASRLSGSLFGFACLMTAGAVLAEPLLTRTAGFSELQALMLTACVGLMAPLTYGASWWLHLRPRPTARHQLSGDEL